MAKFRVNRTQHIMYGTVGTVGGVEMPVQVEMLEVELVDDTGLNGTLTRRYRHPADKAAALEKYVPGSMVDVED